MKLFFLSFFCLLLPLFNASSTDRLAADELEYFNLILDGWEKRVGRCISFAQEIYVFEEIITKIDQNLERIDNVETLRKIYSFGFQAFNYISILCEKINPNSKPLQLQASLISFSRVLFDRKILTEEEIYSFITKAFVSIFEYGSNDPCSALSMLNFNFRNIEMYSRILLFFQIYLKESTFASNTDGIMIFFFYYMDILKQKYLFAQYLRDYHKISMGCLSFIHRHKSSLNEKYFILWLENFFPEYFRFSPSVLEMIFDFASSIKSAKEINIYMKMFTCAQIYSYIFSNINVFNKTGKFLFRMHEAYPEEIRSCISTLNSGVRSVLENQINYQYLLKCQISTYIQAIKLAEKLIDDFVPDSVSNLDSSSSSEIYKIWGDSLNEMAQLNLSILKEENRNKIKSILMRRFELLFQDFYGGYDDEILLLLNSFIPILIKLEENSEEFKMMARKVVSALSDRLERIYSVQDEIEIYSSHIKIHLSEFHGVVFDSSEYASVNLIKFVKHWKMNASALKDFIDYTTEVGWYTDHVVLANLLHRIMILVKSPKPFDLEESQSLGEIIRFFYQDLNIISKTQMMSLYLLLK